MKKFLAIMICGAMLASLAGCTQAAAPQNTAPEETQASTEAPAEISEGSGDAGKKIGISLYYRKDEWYVGVSDEFEKQGKERGYEVFVTDADGNPQNQVEQVENLIEQKIDLMAIAPVDDNGVVSIIDNLRSQEIPVLAYGTKPAGGDFFTFVGWDTYQLGVQLGENCAEYIKNQLGGKANVAMLVIPSMENLKLRSDGFKKALDDSGLDITYVNEQNYDGLRDKALSVMENMIQSNGDIDVVFAAQDPGAFGARTALEAAGVNAKIWSGGGYGEEIYDIFDANDEYIYADYIVSPNLFVAGIYDAIDKYFAGETLEPEFMIEFPVTTVENYKAVWGRE